MSHIILSSNDKTFDIDEPIGALNYLQNEAVLRGASSRELSLFETIQTELAQLKELLATRNTDLRDAIDENSKLKEKCAEYEKSLDICKIVFEQHNFDTECGLVGKALSVLEKWKGKG